MLKQSIDFLQPCGPCLDANITRLVLTFVQVANLVLGSVFLRLCGLEIEDDDH